MTTTQRHFKNNDDAKVVVQEIEQVESKMTILTTKEDLLKLQVDVEK